MACTDGMLLVVFGRGGRRRMCVVCYCTQLCDCLLVADVIPGPLLDDGTCPGPLFAGGGADRRRLQQQDTWSSCDCAPLLTLVCPRVCTRPQAAEPSGSGGAAGAAGAQEGGKEQGQQQQEQQQVGTRAGREESRGRSRGMELGRQ